ncbi:MAG: nicotinate phosphoribosyltransferase [Longimicrobiales bacterium]
MAIGGATITGANVTLLTDLYQLTMLQAYWREGMMGTATFTLFVRRLPEQRNYLLACGLDTVLDWLERLRFTTGELEAVSRMGPFDAAFLDWLGDLRFTGSVRSVAEGTPVFANEPILEVTAPLPEAQLLESYLMNQIHLQTMVASKAARVVRAAAGRAIADFGLRRMHGSDAAIKAARACHIAGVSATSNVLAGALYGIPVTGTMAHSYVQAHDREEDAFRAFATLYPKTTLLVDTYDTLEGVRRVCALAHEMRSRFDVHAIRLDSGDLGQLARAARRILDEAGLDRIEIFASGGLDEYAIANLIAGGAPIDGFGVGTDMGVSGDAPSLDIVYKLAEYEGEGRIKRCPGKSILPGRKQVFRTESEGVATGDVIGLAHETLPGRPLLADVMAAGGRLPAGRVLLDAARAHALESLERLPAPLHSLEPAEPRYAVRISPALEAYASRITSAVLGRS